MPSLSDFQPKTPLTVPQLEARISQLEKTLDKAIQVLGDAITLQVGGSSITINALGITLTGNQVTINSTGKVSIKASADLVLKGAKIQQN